MLAKAVERAKWEEDYERQQEEIKELRKRIRETARSVAHNRPPSDGDKLAYNFFGGRVQNTISRNVRAAEEQLRHIEEDPIAKPPSLMQVNAFFNTQPLQIARLMAAGPNTLLLDEPTNYISLDVLGAFESAMLDFPGPIIAVSHDRWFIQRFGGTLWRLEDGKILQD